MAPHQLEHTLSNRDPLLVVILGPTGSGKTSLSLDLAEHFHGEIVNCDSVAIYREFRIATAKLDTLLHQAEELVAAKLAAARQVRELAAHFGVPVDQALNLLAQHLPAAVDQASPAGTVEPAA